MIKSSTTLLALAVGLTLAAAGSKAAPPSQSSAVPASAAAAAIVPDQPIAFTVDNRYQPCNDFEAYVDAKWNKAHPIPADETRWGAFGYLQKKSLQEQRQILEKAAEDAKRGAGSKLEQKLGRLYAAGMDSAAIDKLGYTPIKPELAKIAAIKSPADVVHFIDTSYANGDGYVFSFYSQADQKHATNQIAYVDQAGLGLPTREYYLSSKPRYQQIRKAYVQYIAKSFELVGTPAAKAAKQAQSVLAFETELAKASLSPTDLNNPDNDYHFVTLAEADKLSPHFSWTRFFAAQGVTINQGFSLSQPKFIKEFNKLLATAPASQWQAYLEFSLINPASQSLSKPFRDNWFDFYGKTLQGQPEQKPRWQNVVAAVNEAMGMGLGQLYVAQYFPPESKARAEKLVANIRAAFKEHVEHLSWMSDATKKKALAKLALYLPKIGYPDKGEWRDWSGLEIAPGNWYADLQAAAKYNYRWEIGKVGTKTDRKQWFMTPQTINAYYSDSTNTINFPAAILQPPFFYAHGDPAVNYGGIGYVIGHETTHGFDKYGSEFNGYGDRVNWWTKEDREKFDALEAKLARQYDQYAPIPGEPNLHVKGEMTIREDTADLGGLNIAYTALQNVLEANPELAKEKIGGFTQDQRFFLSSARVWEGAVRPKAEEVLLNTDPHAPATIRAFASASNMPQFAQAFHCPPGSKMVRQNPIKIW